MPNSGGLGVAIPTPPKRKTDDLESAYQKIMGDLADDESPIRDNVSQFLTDSYEFLKQSDGADLMSFVLRNRAERDTYDALNIIAYYLAGKGSPEDPNSAITRQMTQYRGVHARQLQDLVSRVTATMGQNPAVINSARNAAVNLGVIRELFSELANSGKKVRINL